MITIERDGRHPLAAHGIKISMHVDCFTATVEEHHG